MTICLLIPLTVNAKEYNGIELSEEQIEIANSIGYSEDYLIKADIETLNMIKGIVPESVKVKSVDVYQTTTPITRASDSETSARGDKIVTLSTFTSSTDNTYRIGVSVKYPNGMVPSNSSRKLEGIGITWTNSAPYNDSTFYQSGLYYTGDDSHLVTASQLNILQKQLAPHLSYGNGETDYALFYYGAVLKNSEFGATVTSAEHVLSIPFTNAMPTGVCVSNYDANGKSGSVSFGSTSTYIYPYANASFTYTAGTAGIIDLAQTLNRTNVCL